MTAIAQADGRKIPRRLVVWGLVAALMLLPVLAIRGFNLTAWERPGDLVFMAVLWTGVAIAYEVALRVSRRRSYQAAASIGLSAALLTIWINLAVGIIGNEDNPTNLIYLGPLAIAAGCGALTRFRPTVMALAMTSAAGAQAAVFAIIAISGLGFTGPITVFLSSLWLISACLFREAAQEDRRQLP